ncbi:MAG: response regulator transcription factor [Clostridia bacterium]|nr:response regulator transcription factor [Clostridia bacterium]
MAQTLLIADDESSIRMLIKKYAEFDGFKIVEAVDGMDTVTKALENSIDLAIVDIMMPELDGFSACREIRKRKPELPIIILSARSDEYDRIHGFEIGIDDYVVKPFSAKELIMRVHAVLKRVADPNKTKENTGIIRINGLELNLNAHLVYINGEKTLLSPREYDLLVYLVQNRGIALKREQILLNVWGYDFYGDERTLDTHIKLLRRNLQEYGKQIVTVRGVGYRFDEK